ncbi:hypothetical protein BOTBODRAFT_147832 [Botryobasidium botryosum FD-172 SS1]|uniref:Uncharacterized protein n=1 Tax=Botryobasidium botryosum (strain FD-172 SS1) TaxID=930990 RepID=A0A067MFK7_BOTB1|nr:hypothetical protein BOTBODRAFT_147832 [Botryobasidium botryosum FD-172 SS1]
MSPQDVAQSLQAALASPPPVDLTGVTSIAQQFISGLQSLDEEERATATAELEKELQYTYENLVDVESTDQVQCFFTVLYVLREALPHASIVSLWFYLAIRPALRNTRLNAATVEHVKELVLMTMQSEGESKPDEIHRRVMDLYLLDAPSEHSAVEALEDVDLDSEERKKRRVWKENLQDILITHGLTRPKELFDIVDMYFTSPENRLQLSILLLNFFQAPTAIPIKELTESKLFDTMLCCLQIDNSTSLFALLIHCLNMILPTLTVCETGKARVVLPCMLATLGRALCWRKRTKDDGGVGQIPVDIRSTSEGRALQIKPDLGWTRLESTFDTTVSPPPPDVRQYFTFLYGLWPCNTLAFLRDPAAYLGTAGFESPFTTGWNEAFEVDQIRARGKTLLEMHVVHPALIYHDASNERSDPKLSSGTLDDVPRVISECATLNLSVAMLRARPNEQPPTPLGEGDGHTETSPSFFPTADYDQAGGLEPFEVPLPPSGSSGHDLPAQPPAPTIAPHSAITSLTAMESAMGGITMDDPSSPPLLPLHSSHLPAPSTPLALPSPLPLTPPAQASPHAAEAPLPAEPTLAEVEAISILQREVVLLKNELNFELWSKRQLMSHVAQLHKDRVASGNEEAERQILRNKLKEYEKRLLTAQEQIEILKSENEIAKARHAQWVNELQEKLRARRKEKASWQQAAVELRGEVNDANAMLKAQKKSLEDAQNSVFVLKNTVEENAPKVAKYEEYKRRIDELTKMQILWDDSDERREFKTQKAEIEQLQMRLSNSELLIESLKHANEQLVDTNNSQRNQIISLEARVVLRSPSPATAPSTPRFRPGRPSLSRSGSQQTQSQSQTQNQFEGAAALHTKLAQFEDESTALRAKNYDLEEEVEELRAMVEILRVESSGGMRNARGADDMGRQTSMTQSQSPFSPGMFSGPSPLLSPVALADLMQATEPGDAFSLPR